MMCGFDEYGENVVGDANTQPISEIWNSIGLQIIRNHHRKTSGFKNNSTCRKCSYPRATELNEYAYIGDRVIGVENYINRSQAVGASSRATRIDGKLIRVKLV